VEHELKQPRGSGLGFPGIVVRFLIYTQGRNSMRRFSDHCYDECRWTKETQKI